MSNQRQLICAVRHCRYVAESVIEDFRVCPLHDAPQVRRLLELLIAPAAYLDVDSHPIVLPVGPLTEQDFEERTAEGLLRVEEDTEFIERLESFTSGMTHPNFDLTKDML